MPSKASPGGGASTPFKPDSAHGKIRGPSRNRATDGMGPASGRPPATMSGVRPIAQRVVDRLIKGHLAPLAPGALDRRLVPAWPQRSRDGPRGRRAPSTARRRSPHGACDCRGDPEAHFGLSLGDQEIREQLKRPASPSVAPASRAPVTLSAYRARALPRLPSSCSILPRSASAKGTPWRSPMRRNPRTDSSSREAGRRRGRPAVPRPGHRRPGSPPRRGRLPAGTYPDPDGMLRRPVVVGERELVGCGRRDGLRRTVEGDEEGVALRAHLDAVRECLAHGAGAFGALHRSASRAAERAPSNRCR